jgi:hypothetical protein
VACSTTLFVTQSAQIDNEHWIGKMCKDKLLAHNLTAWPEENQEKPFEAQDRLCAFFSLIQAPLEHRSVAAPVVPEVSSININKTGQMNRIYISCHVTVRMMMW